MNKIVLSVGITLLAIFFLSSPFKAHAEGLGVFPPIIKIKANAGQELSASIKIKNLASEATEVQISFRPFKEEDGRVNFILYKDYTPENSSILKNVRVLEGNQNISNMVLSPGQERNLTLNIKIDNKAKNQDFYFSVVFLTVSKNKSENSYSAVRTGMASNILLSVGDDSQVSVINFSSDLFAQEGKLKFEGEIENSGRNFMTIHPRIRIKNIFGKTIEVIEIEEINLLANSSRNLTGKSKKIESKKEYLFGPYKATLEFSSSNKPVLTSKNLLIMIMPGRKTILTSAVLLLILVIYIKIRKRR